MVKGVECCLYYQLPFFLSLFSFLFCLFHIHFPLSRLFRLLEFAFSLINVCARLADLQDRFGGTIVLLPF